jgi:hypothetical protein
MDPTLGDRLETEASAHLELVGLVRAARPELKLLEMAAVGSARRAGCSWEQIGAVLGISRQAAQQRYGSLDPDVVVQPHQRVLRPLTAFNEMAVLNTAGRYGWHSVGYGFFYHLVELDDRQWEHARTIFGRKPHGDGWAPIGDGWGAWWTYWGRRLDVPALAADADERLLPWS